MRWPHICARWALFLALALPAASPLLSPSLAQDGSVSAEQALRQSRQAYGPAPPNPDCPPPMPGEEIVVCAPWEDDSQFRVQSSAQLDTTSREATKDPVPRAPDVAGEGIFKGPATVGGGCFLNGCPPPPAYFIDFSLLPEAPEGSDADRIAKGEALAP